MNATKSLFISLYITFLVIANAWAFYRIWLNPEIGTVGLLVATLPAMMFFLYVFLTATARTGAALLPLQILVFVGAGVSFLSAEWLVVTTAILAAVGWLAYIHWYSRLGREESVHLKSGVQLPELWFENPKGDKVSLEDFSGQPVLMLFYRGNWCPLCMAQIREIAEGYRALNERGVQLLMISPQPHEQTQTLAEKFDAPLEFLVDKHSQMARKLGIIHEGGLPAGLQVAGYDTDTTMPTVILADAKGKVIAADQTDNYRVRPEPEVFLSWLDQAES